MDEESVKESSTHEDESSSSFVLEEYTVEKSVSNSKTSETQKSSTELSPHNSVTSLNSEDEGSIDSIPDRNNSIILLHDHLRYDTLDISYNSTDSQHDVLEQIEEKQLTSADVEVEHTYLEQINNLNEEIEFLQNKNDSVTNCLKSTIDELKEVTKICRASEQELYILRNDKSSLSSINSKVKIQLTRLLNKCDLLKRKLGQLEKDKMDLISRLKTQELLNENLNEELLKLETTYKEMKTLNDELVTRNEQLENETKSLEISNNKVGSQRDSFLADYNSLKLLTRKVRIDNVEHKANIYKLKEQIYALTRKLENEKEEREQLKDILKEEFVKAKDKLLEQKKLLLAENETLKTNHEEQLSNCKKHEADIFTLKSRIDTLVMKQRERQQYFIKRLREREQELKSEYEKELHKIQEQHNKDLETEKSTQQEQLQKEIKHLEEKLKVQHETEQESLRKQFHLRFRAYKIMQQEEFYQKVKQVEEDMKLRYTLQLNLARENLGSPKTMLEHHFGNKIEKKDQELKSPHKIEIGLVREEPRDTSAQENGKQDQIHQLWREKLLECQGQKNLHLQNLESLTEPLTTLSQRKNLTFKESKKSQTSNDEEELRTKYDKLILEYEKTRNECVSLRKKFRKKCTEVESLQEIINENYAERYTLMKEFKCFQKSKSESHNYTPESYLRKPMLKREDDSKIIIKRSPKIFETTTSNFLQLSSLGTWKQRNINTDSCRKPQNKIFIAKRRKFQTSIRIISKTRAKKMWRI